MNRQFEEKLKSREAEIFRLREETRSRQKELTAVGQRSRRQSTNNTRVNSEATTENDADQEEFKFILENKEKEISVRYAYLSKCLSCQGITY